MLKTRLLLVPLSFLVVIGLLIGGGWAIHRIGWTEGYAVGMGAAAGEVTAVPYAPTGFSYLGLFLTAGLAFLVLMALVGKLLGLLAFRTVAGPWMMAHRPPRGPMGPNGERWASYWHKHPHHMPPWCWSGEQAAEQKSADTGPGMDGASSEKPS